MNHLVVTRYFYRWFLWFFYDFVSWSW